MRALRAGDNTLLNGRPATTAAPRALGKLLVAGAVVALLIAAAGSAQIAAARPDPAFLGLGLASGRSDNDGTVHLRLFFDNGGRADVEAPVRIERAGTASTPASIVWTGSVRAGAGAAGTFDVAIPSACGLRLSVLVTAADQGHGLDVLVPCAPAP